MFTKEYWDNRAKKHGHTGHSEPFYYCFDQQARLFAIEEIIKKNISKKGNALDFGCGSGDFIELLMAHFEKVYGYDISETVVCQAKKRFNSSNCLITNKIDDCSAEKGFDLILTVTVLQSLTQNELESTLSMLSQLLSDSGVIVSMEFFASEEHNSRTHETRTTHSEFLDLLVKNNLKIDSTIRFYSPVEFPSKSWLLYKNNAFLKLLRIFKHSPRTQNYFTKVARKLILQHRDVFPKNDSHYMVYIIKK